MATNETMKTHYNQYDLAVCTKCDELKPLLWYENVNLKLCPQL